MASLARKDGEHLAKCELNHYYNDIAHRHSGQFWALQCNITHAPSFAQPDGPFAHSGPSLLPRERKTGHTSDSALGALSGFGEYYGGAMFTLKSTERFGMDNVTWDNPSFQDTAPFPRDT